MNENQKAFIRRHIQNLIEKEYVGEEALEKSLTVLQDRQRSKEIVNYFKKNGSLTKTLHHFSVIQIDQPLVDVLENLEQRTTNQQTNIQALLDADETIASILSLFKVKLTMGLSYALWLSIIATIIFSIVQLKILPQFEALFMDFGAELPALTQAALDWQNSFFSPTLLGLILVVAVGYLLALIRMKALHKLLLGNSLHTKLIKIFPFVKSVLDYLQSIKWLSALKTLVASGQTLSESENLLSSQPKQLEKYLPEINNSLATAAEIDNVMTEIEYQQNQLELIAEDLVSKATAKLTASIMLIVVGYVVFTIFASYLPIFQLGAVV